MISPFFVFVLNMYEPICTRDMYKTTYLAFGLLYLCGDRPKIQKTDSHLLHLLPFRDSPLCRFSRLRLTDSTDGATLGVTTCEPATTSSAEQRSKVKSTHTKLTDHHTQSQQRLALVL